MDFDAMSREQLIEELKELTRYMDNVVVFWGGKQEFKDTLSAVAANESQEFTKEESENASLIMDSDGAFDTFIELVRDSFDRGGINYMLSEKISALMEEVADRYRKN